ncbi:MAG: chromosome partitioning protein ParB, partial [Actinomycetota bacterium]|nr:chromosome partitioning protein ParB [Actinomycetota bacterium]
TPDRAYQEALAKRTVAEQLSVRAVEDSIRERNHTGGVGPPGRATGSARLRAPGILELEELLSNHLDTRVKVDLGARKGRVVIDFATLEDLERIYRVMTLGVTEPV